MRDTAVTLGYQPGQRTGTAFWARILIQTSTASGCAGGAPISTGVIFPSGMGLALGTGNQIFTQCFDNGIAVSDSTSCPVTATAFGPDPTFWNMGLRTVTFGHTYEVRFAVRANSALTGQAMTGKAVDQTVLGSPSAYQFTVATYVNAAPNPGYTSLVPVRLLDTRAGLGAPAAAVGPGATVNLQVAGRGGVPSSGAGAVALNVTVAGPTGRGYLTVYPTGSGRPVASNLNFTVGQTIPNMVIARLGTGGMVTLYNGSGGRVHLVADAAGWFDAATSDPGPGRYGPLVPVRLLDTRAGLGAPAAAVAPGATVNLQVAGRGGVPSSGAGAVALNVTVAGPTGPGYLTVYPTGSGRPVASNLNFTAGQTIPNMVIARLGTSGMVSIYNGSAGTAHLLADVGGWFKPVIPDSEASPGSYAPLVPARLLDTRTGLGAPTAAVAPGATVTLQVAGRGGVFSGAAAAVLNVTVTDPKGTGYLTVYPTGSGRPVASNLNFTAGQTIPNMVITRLGTSGMVTIYNGSSRTVHVLADAMGAFSP